MTDQALVAGIHVELEAPRPPIGSLEGIGDAGEIIAVVIGGLIRMAAGLLPIGVALALLIFVFRGISRRRKRGE